MLSKIYKIKEEPDNIFFRCVEDCLEAIMITDSGGILQYVNPAWKSIYGYSKEEALGNTPRMLRSQFQDKSFYQKMWDTILSEQGFWRGELINRAKNGDHIPVYLTITPFKDKENETVGYMGIAVDQRVQKRLEKEVEWQDRMASVGLIASGLGHEIGTPMGVIRGRAEMLRMKSKSESDNKNLDIILTQIDRISKLISSLLKFSRKSEDIRLETHPVRSVVDEVIILLEEKLHKISCKVTVDISTELKASFDFGKLQQILINLLINSIHAVEKSNQPNKEIVIAGSQKNKKTYLTISDNGCGIPAQNLKKIFTPFFTTKDVGQGTGLGLPIVAKIMSELGGNVEIESQEGQGTTVILTFPSA